MAVDHRGGFHGTGEFLLDVADNGTVFTWREDVVPPLGVAGRAAFALAVRPHLERVFTRSLGRLRALVLDDGGDGAVSRS
jgi:hypothetical protein